MSVPVDKKLDKANQTSVQPWHLPSADKPVRKSINPPPSVKSGNVELTIGAKILNTPVDGGATELIPELDAGSASQAVPSFSADVGLKYDVMVVEKVSRNGVLEWKDPRGFVIPLNVVTSMRVSLAKCVATIPV